MGSRAGERNKRNVKKRETIIKKLEELVKQHKTSR